MSYIRFSIFLATWKCLLSNLAAALNLNSPASHETTITIIKKWNCAEVRLGATFLLRVSECISCITEGSLGEIKRTPKLLEVGHS